MSLYGCWTPDPDNVPPWATLKGRWWFCEACWKYLDEKHVVSAEHHRRLHIWMYRTAAQSAEARPSDTRWPTESTVCKSPAPHQDDFAELRILLRAGQGRSSAEAVPLPVLSSTQSVASETVTRDDLAKLRAFLSEKQDSAIGLAAVSAATPPTQTSPPCRHAASPPAAVWIPAVPEGPQQIQISTPPTPLPPRLSTTSIAAVAAAAASADQKIPMLAACPVAASPPAPRWGQAGSEEYQQTPLRLGIETPELFQTSTPPQPPPPHPISTSIPPPPLLYPAGSEEYQQTPMMHGITAPKLFQTTPPPQPPPPHPISTLIPPSPPLCPDATMSAAGSTTVGYSWPQQTQRTFFVEQVPNAGSDYWLRETRMRLGDQIQTTGSTSTGYFGSYDTRLTYKDGNVCLEYTRDGQRALALTMPAHEATRLAAALTGLMQLVPQASWT